MNEYIFTLNSDTGIFKLKVLDITLSSAIKRCLDNQLAPERAIVNIKIKHKN